MKVHFALRRVETEQGLSAKNSIEDAQSLNLAIDRLFEVRKFISLESYDEAIKHLNYIEQTWPFLSATYELKGGIFFLQKKYRDALSAYSMSLKYNPRSVPSAQMRESLEQQLGVSGDELVREYEVKRIPASELKKAREQGAKGKTGAADQLSRPKGGAMPDLPDKNPVKPGVTQTARPGAAPSAQPAKPKAAPAPSNNDLDLPQ
jgi:tetratricopeptide (TPR) repeat protein